MDISNDFVGVRFECTQFHPEKVAKSATSRLIASNSAEKGSAKVTVDRLAKNRALKDVSNKAHFNREFIKSKTLPYGSRGERIIHITELAGLTSEIGEHIKHQEQLVKVFMSQYDSARSEGIRALANILDNADIAALYPTAAEVSAMFTTHFGINVLPSGVVPDTIPSMYVEAIKLEQDKLVSDAQFKASEDVASELLELLSTVRVRAEQAVGGSKVSPFTDKALRAPKQMLARYQHLSKLTGNSDLESILQEFAGIDVRGVKESTQAAQEVIKMADDITSLLSDMGVQGTEYPKTLPAPEPVIEVEVEPEVEAVKVAEVEPEVEAAPVVEKPKAQDQVSKTNNALDEISALLNF